MKGGVVLSLGVARALAERPDLFAELAMLLVTDEEWRTAPVRPRRGVRRATTRACASRPASAGRSGEEGVVVRRKAAGTLRVIAAGRPSHSGSAPDQGVNALLALAENAVALAAQA